MRLEQNFLTDYWKNVDIVNEKMKTTNDKTIKTINSDNRGRVTLMYKLTDYLRKGKTIFKNNLYFKNI